jgi:hypothetical protein
MMTVLFNHWATPKMRVNVTTNCGVVQHQLNKQWKRSFRMVGTPASPSCAHAFQEKCTPAPSLFALVCSPVRLINIHCLLKCYGEKLKQIISSWLWRQLQHQQFYLLPSAQIFVLHYIKKSCHVFFYIYIWYTPSVSRYLSFDFFALTLTTHLIQNKIYNYYVF